MIRSTRNESIKTIQRLIAGHRSESREHTFGSVDGVAPAAAAQITEAEYDAAAGNTYSPIHGHEHWDGTTITR